MSDDELEDNLPALPFSPKVLLLLGAEFTAGMFHTFAKAAYGLQLALASDLKKQWLDYNFAREIGRDIESLPTTEKE